MWAMSVLANAKSESHRKPHWVELDGAGRKYRHLTQGDLRPERAGEVSKVRSSEEAYRKASGAKGRRVTRTGHDPNSLQQASRRSKDEGRCNCGSHPLRRGMLDEWILMRETGLAVESKAVA